MSLEIGPLRRGNPVPPLQLYPSPKIKTEDSSTDFDVEGYLKRIDEDKSKPLSQEKQLTTQQTFTFRYNGNLLSVQLDQLKFHGKTDEIIHFIENFVKSLTTLDDLIRNCK